MTHIRKKALLAACVGLLALGAFSADAWALKVTLKRIVFEGPRRAEVLSIINNTAEEQAYRLSWRPMRMTEDEPLIVVEDDAQDDAQAAGLKPADDLVRYAPRRIVVPPGGTQQVRLMFSKPKDLADGEYRSHLWLQPEADNVKFDQMGDVSADRPQVQLKMLTGMTIPVIVRHGQLSVKARFSDVRVARNPDGKGMDVDLTVGRQGNRSLYGDFKFTCDGGTLAQEIKGVAVYTEVTQRHLHFTVPFPANDSARCQTLNVEYIADQDDFDLKGAVLATAAVAVP